MTSEGTPSTVAPWRSFAGSRSSGLDMNLFVDRSGKKNLGGTRPMGKTKENLNERLKMRNRDPRDVQRADDN